jgi:hypothetical protein
MKPSKLREHLVPSGLVIGFILFMNPGLSGCGKPVGTTTDSCEAYYNLLCEKIETESNECVALKTTTSVISQAACAAGSKDVDETVRKLSDAQKLRHDLADKVCAAIGSESVGCKSVTKSYRYLSAGQAKGISEHLPEVIAHIKQRAGSEQSAGHVSTSEETANASGVSSVEEPSRE